MYGDLEVQVYGFRDIYLFKNCGNWSEMGQYVLIWAHIKTGQSPMAQDHFQTPLDQKNVYKKEKMNQKCVQLHFAECLRIRPEIEDVLQCHN